MLDHPDINDAQLNELCRQLFVLKTNIKEDMSKSMKNVNELVVNKIYEIKDMYRNEDFKTASM